MHCKAPVSFRFVSESKRVGESTCKRNGRSPILTNPDAMVSSEDTLFTVHKLHIFRLSKDIICKDTKAGNIISWTIRPRFIPFSWSVKTTCTNPASVLEVAIVTPSYPCKVQDKSPHQTLLALEYWISHNVKVPNDDRAKKEDDMTNDQTEHKL